MIIQNRLGDAWLWVCSRFNRFKVGGFAFPFVIVIRSSIDITKPSGKCLVVHEKKHQEQMRRYWYIGYVVLYIYQWARYGYANMPLEKEAYKIQRECLANPDSFS